MPGADRGQTPSQQLRQFQNEIEKQKKKNFKFFTAKNDSRRRGRRMLVWREGVT